MTNAAPPRRNASRRRRRRPRPAHELAQGLPQCPDCMAISNAGKMPTSPLASVLKRDSLGLPTSLPKSPGHVGLAVDTRPVFSCFTLGVDGVFGDGGPASVVIARWGMYKPSSLIAGQQRSQQAVFGFTAVCSDGVTGPNHHDSRSVFRFCLLKVAKHSTRRMRTGVQDRGNECLDGPRRVTTGRG